MHFVCMEQTASITNPMVLQRTVGEATLFPDFIRFCIPLMYQKRIFLSSIPFIYRAKRTDSIGLLALFFWNFLWDNINKEGL